jgi:integrase
MVHKGLAKAPTLSQIGFHADHPRIIASETTHPEHVFPSAASKTKHLVEIKRLWRQVAKTAGLVDVRIHDLRHSFASILVSGGASLPLIGALLGHRSPATTQRYAHLHLDPQRQAVETVGAAFIAAGRPNQPPRPRPCRRSSSPEEKRHRSVA